MSEEIDVLNKAIVETRKNLDDKHKKSKIYIPLTEMRKGLITLAVNVAAGDLTQ